MEKFLLDESLFAGVIMVEQNDEIVNLIPISALSFNIVKNVKSNSVNYLLRKTYL